MLTYVTYLASPGTSTLTHSRRYAHTSITTLRLTLSCMYDYSREITPNNMKLVICMLATSLCVYILYLLRVRVHVRMCMYLCVCVCACEGSKRTAVLLACLCHMSAHAIHHCIDKCWHLNMFHHYDMEDHTGL